MPSAVTVLANTPLEALIGELPGRVALLVAEGSPREIKDAADYLRTQLRRAGLAFEVRNAAAQAWLELEAGCGAKLAGKLAVGAPPKTVSRPDSFRLKDVGISRNLSVRMQAIAAIPQRVRAQYYKTAQDSGWEISWGGRDGLEARAAADHYDLNRTRPRDPADQYYRPAGTGSDRDRPDPAYYHFDRSGERTEYFTRANDPAWKIRSPKRLPYFHNDPELSTQANKNHGIVAPSVQRHLLNISAQPRVDLRQGDCLKLMGNIADHSIDLILADLPYGEQRLPWDTAIDLDALWQHYRRILKPNRPVLLFGGMPFGAALIASNQSWFKYNLIWIKRRAADFIHANNRPMTFHDEIQVFSEGAIATTKKSSRRMPYYPANVSTRPLNNPDGYPRSVIEFVSEESHHPTPKPVALLSYLIELYSMPGETVLDNTMGSGSTGVAALRSGRNFIGIEQHKPFFDVACGRLNTDLDEAAD